MVKTEGVGARVEDNGEDPAKGPPMAADDTGAEGAEAIKSEEGVPPAEPSAPVDTAATESDEDVEGETLDTITEMPASTTKRERVQTAPAIPVSLEPASPPSPAEEDGGGGPKRRGRRSRDRRHSIASQSIIDQADMRTAALAAKSPTPGPLDDPASPAAPSPESVRAAENARNIKTKLVLYTVSMNAILVSAANTIYIPGMKQVERDLDTTTAMVTLTLTSYTIGQGIQPLISGPVADAIGRRKPMMAAHVAFFTASIVCAVAPNVNFLIAARVVQALGGCTFLIVGQAQVGDIFNRDELSEALAFFSLSRMFAAMLGPLAGGLLCEIWGWRSTFWACALVDGVLAIISFFYVPETLTTPMDERPKLTLFSPFKPLAELKHKSAGILCVLSGVNHGLVYMPMVTLPQIMSLMTQNEFIIGAMMIPLVSGTIIGSKVAGKLARPVPKKLAEGETPPPTPKLWNSKSFWRTWFPWSVCGQYFPQLDDFDDDEVNEKPVPRFLGFRMPAIGEWRSVLIGICGSVTGAATFGWFTVLFCDDGRMINTSPATSNVTNWHEYDPLDVDDMLYRLDNSEVPCEWNWVAVILQFVFGFIMCLGAMLVIVGSMTYLSVCRPKTRSSVAASQRSCQMFFAAITLTVGGSLFETIGPAWMHTALAAWASLFISTLCCLNREPMPEKEKKAPVKDADDVKEASRP